MSLSVRAAVERWPIAGSFVICHEPTRTNMRGVEHPLPTIGEVIDLTIQLGRLTNPNIRPIGIAINTQALGDDEARSCLDTAGAEYGLPAVDPIRTGVGPIVDRLADVYGRP